MGNLSNFNRYFVFVMSIQDYVSKINARYASGISTEHSYRGDLQNLLESLAPDVMVTNEPSRVACGAPDYILTRKKESNSLFSERLP